MKGARKLAALALAAVLAASAGCDNMAKGTRIRPLEESRFFSDGQSSRMPPPHSIAQGRLEADTQLFTGREPNGSASEEFPWPINGSVLARGRIEYDAICASCHGADGYGGGIIVRRGFPAPPSFHEQRLIDAPPGRFFDVITHGYGAMYPYASIVEGNDRWAITAYIRALQRSQRASAQDLPAEELANLTARPVK